MAMKLLIAEDASDVAEVVAFGARMNWPDCRVIVASSGVEALRRFEEERVDLVVLDVSMPPPDGFEVCRRIRETSSVPVLMLTVRDATSDKVMALDLGADDYLTKPFDHEELLARLRALARRTGRVRETSASSARTVVGDVSLDYATREVWVRGEPVRLSSTEYRLLEVLVRNAGTALSHRTLLSRVWGPRYVGDTHYLKVFVRRLRQKLGDNAARPRYIHTEWGVGYRFAPPD